MSDSASETEPDRHEKPEVGLIPDEALPEDLQPEQNPLAADPDDESGSDGDGDGPGEPKADGMPDMGQPGQVPG